MERVQLWQLLVDWYCHVILHCIQPAKGEVEDAYCVSQLQWELLDDYSKAAR